MSTGDRWNTRDYGSLGPGVWVFGGLMVVIGVVTTVLMLQDFRSRSYLYLAFYAIPANTAITVFPHEPVLIYFGKFANVWVTAAAATAGTVAAGFMDHTVFTPLLNLEGRQAWKEKDLYRRAAEWFGRWPFPTLVLAGFTPVPFWPFKFLTFSAHYPLSRYLVALVVGRFPRYVILAWVGQALEVPNWILFGFFLAVIVVYLVKAGPRLLERWRSRDESMESEGESQS